MGEKLSKKFSILGVGISAINMEDAVSFIENAISNRQKRYICVCPISTIMECKKNADVMKSVNSADLATPDGMGVVWLGMMRGHKNIKRVYGPQLMRRVCDISVSKGYKHYLYGSTQEVLDSLNARLDKNYPGINVAGRFSPPFRKLTKDEDEKIINDINSSNADIVWVGLGSPKQDLWMHEYRSRINASILIGVGAAFDFLAGVKPQAPAWIGDHGFEWLFRLLTEPKRLWRRYLIDYPLFFFYLLLDLIAKVFLNFCMRFKSFVLDHRK